MKKLGDILIEMNKVDKRDVDRALILQKENGQKLGKILLSLGYITEKDLVAEYFMNRLRLFRSFTEEEFEQRTFLNRSLVKPGLELALNKKLLLKQSDKYLPSETGYRFLNDLTEIFV